MKECTIDHFIDHIKGFDDKDNPEIFGLNQDADLAYQKKVSLKMMNTILETRPKESNTGGGQSMEESVKIIVTDFLDKMPKNKDLKKIREVIEEKKGPQGALPSHPSLNCRVIDSTKEDEKEELRSLWILDGSW